MGFIYQIVNDINDKIYIGATNFSLEKRFKEHYGDSKKERAKNRPLYKAIREYGFEHFRIELIEITNDLENREKYWINKKNTVNNGYNLSYGGKGKKLIDEKEVVNLYKEHQEVSAVAAILGIDNGQASKILTNNGIAINSSTQVVAEKYSKPINMLSLDGQILQEFKNSKEAAEYIIKSCNGKYHTTSSNMTSHICAVCNNKRKIAYGYKWKYCNE